VSMVPEPLRVLSASRESRDVVTLTLDAGEGGGRPSLPGQFNMLYAFGVGEVAISLSGDPAEPRRLVHTVRAVGAVTEAICGLKRGGVVGVRGPYGAPWPMGEARGRDLFLLAGGLGLAPLRPALYAALGRRGEYGRVVLVVGARAPEDLLFRRELERWRATAGLEVLVTVDRATADWQGHVGVLPALLPRAGLDPQRAVAFVCGPEIMMRFCVRELGRLGVPDARVYLSMERNMKCALGFCGHCQLGPHFICRDGPVLPYDRLGRLFWQKEA
jgi:NAD(P)H-flavin reductase